MRYTTKILSIVVAILLIGLALTSSTLGADNDTFTVDMTGEYLECNVNNATWQPNSTNPVTMSTRYWTNETGKTFIADTVNCTVNVDFQMQITTDDASGWSSNDAGVPAEDKYRLNASTNIWASENLQVLTSGYTTIHANQDKDTNVTFDLRIDTPTSTTTGASHTFTVTAKVIKT